jgi:immune inhibitor A
LTFSSLLRKRPAAITTIIVVILFLIPSGTSLASLGDSLTDDLEDQRARKLLERMHTLPEVLEEVPPAPWYVDQVEAEGGQVPQPVSYGNTFLSETPAVTGTKKLVSLAIEFTDVKHRSGNTIGVLQNRLTGSNSLKSYYEEVSQDNISIDATANGWYTAANTMAYYGAPAGGGNDNNQNLHKLLREAVQAADAAVDFSQYDANNNRLIDGICLVHSGRDEATGGGSNAIWSKMTYYPGTLRVDGVYVGYYFIVSEDSPVGVIAHEYGHMLGLPDLYDTDYSSTGVGTWDLMGSGAWTNGGRTPVHLSAWSKMYLGWLDITTISNFVEGYQLRTTSNIGGKAIKLPTESSQQFFLLEVRYNMNYDRYIAGSGLLIWHIDQGVISSQYRVNDNEFRKGVDLEEASGTQELDGRGYNDGRFDVWKSNLVGFTPDSEPDSRLYDGTDTKIRVFNISAAGTVMTIDIDFGGDSYAVFMDTANPIVETGPGVEALYNITVGTRSAIGDTVHITLTGTHSSWGWIASSEMTLNLGPKGAKTIQIKVTPPSGTPKDVEGQVIINGRSGTSGLTAELETITVVKQVHALTALPTTKTVYVVPGVSQNLDISITNAGNGLENVTLAMEGERTYWTTLNPGRISLDVLETQVVRITFSVPMGIMAGDEEAFTIILFSEVVIAAEEGEQISLQQSLDIPITMVVDEVISMRWGSIQDAHLLPGDNLTYELTLYNEGNSNITALVGYQIPDGWDLVIQNGDSIDIPAFEAVTFNATLYAPANVLFGTTVNIDMSAGIGVDFFYTAFEVTVDQLFDVSVSGQLAKFSDPAKVATFNITLTNMGNGDDRVDINVMANGGLWSVTTDENFVDLGADEGERTRELHVFVTPPADAEAFNEKTFVIEFTSENGEVTASHTVTTTVNPISSFSVETEVITDSIDPGTAQNRYATYYVHVKNTGNLEDLFHIGLMDLPEGWTSLFESRMVSVPANKRKLVEFQIAPPVGDVTTEAGTFNFRVHVASELGNGEPAEAPLAVFVQANRGHSIQSLEPSYTAPSGSKLTFRVLVINEGNIPETVTLSAVGNYETISFETVEVSLEAFGQRVVNVTVELPSSKEDTSMDLQVIATTSDLTKQEHTTVPVEVEGRSGVPGLAATGTLVALAVAALVSVGVAGRRRLR